MTTIDHRILIAANPPVVWDYISNLSRNSKWQVDCKNVTFLTGKHEGPGTRWRQTSESGREYVLEVTAWYNGLGYEYVFVDGPGYEENIGRIRLQEIPEGTIVQWTFTYSLPGLFGGMRDSLSTRRQIDKSIADSLRKLYLQIKAHGATSPLEPKSLMRDAPNAEERAQYQPRHPSQPKEGEKPAEPVIVRTPGLPIIDEPPLSDDDAQSLKPFMPISERDLQPAPPAPIIDEPPPAVDDTRPNPVIKPSSEPTVTTPLPLVSEVDSSSSDKLSTAEVESIPPHSEPDFDFSFEMESTPPPAYVPPVTSSAPVVIAEPEPDPLYDTQPRQPVDDAPPASAPYAEPTLTHPVAPAEPEAMPVIDDAPPVTAINEPTEEHASEPVEVKLDTPVERPKTALPPLPEPEPTKILAPEPELEVPAPVMDEPVVEEPVVALPAAVEPPPAPEPVEVTKLNEGPTSRPWEEPTISPNATMAQPTTQDTANISIWEIFGVQRPSETQQMKAVSDVKPEPLTKAKRPDMTPLRMGLRTALRRQRKTIRRIKPTQQ